MMKNNAPFRQPAGLTIGSFIVIFMLAYLSMLAVVHSESRAGDDRLSLDLKDAALGDVLQLITKKTGYEFSIEDRWKNYPVSISIKDKPLHEALRRILGKFNSAIIYSPDRKLKIIIYDRVAANETLSDHSVTAPISRLPLPQPSSPADAEEPKAPGETPEHEDVRQAKDDASKETEKQDDKPEESKTENEKEKNKPSEKDDDKETEKEKSEEDESADEKPEKTN
jgi:hypothetical protein